MRERANTQPRGKHSAQCLIHSRTAKTTFAIGLPQNCPLVYNDILPLCKVGHTWQGMNRKIKIFQTGIVSHWSEKFFLDQIFISMLSCCCVGASFLSKSTLFLIWICLLNPIEFSQELLATHCETPCSTEPILHPFGFTHPHSCHRCYNGRPEEAGRSCMYNSISVSQSGCLSGNF